MENGKKVCSSMLTLAMVLTLLAAIPLTAQRAEAEGVPYYNANLALQYAAANWNNNDGTLCAEFVDNCVRAGGINIPIKKTTSEVYKAITAATGVQSVELAFDSNGYIPKSLNEGKLAAGDVVYQYCNTHQVSPHIVFCGGFDANGRATFYAHNSAHNNEALKLNHNTAYQHTLSCNIVCKALHISGGDKIIGKQTVQDGRYHIVSALDEGKCVHVVNTLEMKAGTYMSGDQIANYCNSKVGTGYPAGYCLGWVSNVFQSLGAERSCGCCAYNYGRSRIVSTSDSDIPVGADVFFSGSQTRCSSCGNTCGHVAIYVGGGYVVHSYGGSIHKDTLARVKSWSGYSYMGWGIHGNVDLDYHHDPEGCVDAIEPHGEGKVLVRGWTFDRDVPGNALEIHVYIGGPAGSAGVEGHVVGHADKSRPDVDNVFHTGSNHGFEFVIDTGKSGNQAVYVYAINQGGGTNNPAIGNKTINIAPAHTHIAAPAVKENEKKATCTDAGSYDEVVYCSACHAQMSRNQKTVAVLGYDWGEWTVEKEATEKEAGLEVRVCKRDKNHQEEREIPQIVHQHVLKQVAEKLPECEADGYETYWRCEGCGRMFEDADADVELDEEEVVLEAVGHVPGEPVTEHVIAAGCETEGADEKIVCCSVCGKKLQREQIATEPAGHDYGEWTVIEEPAQGKKGLKIRVCRKDAGHIDKEEIPALEEAENGTGSDVSEGESDGGEQNLQSNSQASNGIEENLNNEPAGQDSENRSQASDRNNLNRELVGQNLESTPDRNGDISKQASEDGQKTDSAQQVVSGVEDRGSGGQKADDLREGYSEALGDPAGGVEKTVDIQSSVAIENPSGETGIQGQGMEQKDAVTEDRTGDKTDADRTVTSKEGVKDVINVEKDSLWNEEQKAGTIETVGETQTKEEVSAIERTKTDAEPQMAGEPKTDTKLWMNGENVSHICREAFNGCRKLNGITLPESVKEIGNNAFSGCKKLRSLTIHSTRMTSKTLSRSAFKGLSKKTVVRVPSNMRKTYKKLFVKKGLSKKARIR